MKNYNRIKKSKKRRYRKEYARATMRFVFSHFEHQGYISSIVDDYGYVCAITAYSIITGKGFKNERP